MIKARYINLLSDCGHYELIARLVAKQGATGYYGADWDVKLRKDKQVVSSINGVNFGKNEGGVCKAEKLNKTIILYGAIKMNCFSKALYFGNVDTKKVEREYEKELSKC